MATIDIRFDFSRDNDGHEDHSDIHEFEVESGLLSFIDEYKDDSLSDLNTLLEDGETEWEFDEWEVNSSDDDLASPSSFDDLDAYAEYVEECEEHGEGYRLRYDDIGEFNFQDSYNGCWNSEEEFVQDLVESCYDIPDFLNGHIDWESMTRDYMMDYTTYEGIEGNHIFRD